MPAIADSDFVANGGSPILSYKLLWNWGSGGSTFVALVGVTSDNLVLQQTVSGLTVGATYWFRYQVRNTYGWGEESGILVAVAATIPDTPAQPRTSNTGRSVKIAWSDPYNGGSPVTSLRVEIRAVDGVSFYSEPLYCNGESDATVRAQGYCVIP